MHVDLVYRIFGSASGRRIYRLTAQDQMNISLGDVHPNANQVRLTKRLVDRRFTDFEQRGGR